MVIDDRCGQLRRDNRVGISGQQLLRHLTKGILDRGGLGSKRECPDDIKTVTWPRRYDRFRDCWQRRRKRGDTVVLPADQNDAGVAAHHTSGQLGFVVLSEGGGYLKPEAITKALDRLIGPVNSRLGRITVGRREQDGWGLQSCLRYPSSRIEK